jgi:hypothetical protein
MSKTFKASASAGSGIRWPIENQEMKTKNRNPMKQLHVITVGISLLTNYAHANGIPVEKALRRSKDLPGFLKRISSGS